VKETGIVIDRCRQGFVTVIELEDRLAVRIEIDVIGRAVVMARGGLSPLSMKSVIWPEPPDILTANGQLFVRDESPATV
jgi:hypothetical protein